MSTLAERPGSRARNPLLELRAHGQSIWLDYIRRNLKQRGRRVLRVQLGRDTAAGLLQLQGILGG
jgi:hypothetical protein